MARQHCSSLVLVALIALTAVAEAKTWFVGGSGADFDEIQAAIVAASDGDVIIVRTGKVYQPITIDNKSLSIRASSALRFETEAAIIRNLAADKVVHLGGMTIKSDFPYTYKPLFSINRCAGEVDLDNINLTTIPFVDYTGVSFGTLLRVAQSDNVTFTSLRVKGITGWHDLFGDLDMTVDIDGSTVQILDAEITGHVAGQGVIKGPGGDAVEIRDSQVLLTRPSISGGAGQAAAYYGSSCAEATKGGNGMVVFCGDVIITGDATDFVSGGAGGDGFQNSVCCASGVDGGIGIVAHCDNTVSIAGAVVVRGGSGGLCAGCTPPCLPGFDGAPFTGNPKFLPRPYPVLDTTGDLVPGGAMSITVLGEPAANALLLVSNRRGWIWLPGVYGAPWNALPGGVFFVFGIGRIPPSGRLELPPLTLPDDPSLQGFAISTQAVVLALGGVELSNGSTRIVGE